MNFNIFPLWFVDVCGAMLMIVFAFACLRLALRLKRSDAQNVLWTYLFWVCVALTVFSVSRSAGHIVRQLLVMSEKGRIWAAIRPYSGAINTITFIVVGSVTLFFGRTWAVYQAISRDRQALQAAHEELLFFNQNLERLVEQRTEALAISEQRYRRIFEVSKDMILVTRKDGLMLNMNPAGYHMLGLSPGNDFVRGTSFRQYLWDKNDWEKIIESIERKGFLASVEFDLRTSDGSRKAALFSGSLSREGPEEKDQIHFLIKDIEQRRMMREQMAQADKLASIGELSAGIAHEINNPLGIILGYTQLLLRAESEKSERYADLKTIEKHVRSCKTIVEDLLNFARTSSPKKELVDIHKVIEEVISFVRHHADLEKIRLETFYDRRISPLLLDEKKIKQVLINLIMNARHAVDGKGSITVSTALNENQTKAVIKVKDDGYGIEKKNLNRIFDPFFTTKPTGQGTGLGLSVSYGIIKNHGGSIYVRSQPGQGSTFTIVLPLSKGKRNI